MLRFDRVTCRFHVEVPKRHAKRTGRGQKGKGDEEGRALLPWFIFPSRDGRRSLLLLDDVEFFADSLVECTWLASPMDSPLYASGEPIAVLLNFGVPLMPVIGKEVTLSAESILPLTKSVLDAFEHAEHSGRKQVADAVNRGFGVRVTATESFTLDEEEDEEDSDPDFAGSTPTDSEEEEEEEDNGEEDEEDDDEQYLRGVSDDDGGSSGAGSGASVFEDDDDDDLGEEALGPITDA